MARASDPIQARTGATWIVRTLRDRGHTAYFAGGCVRDGLLGLHPTDFDVATDATPQRVRELFRGASEVGASFGVMLVRVPIEHAPPAPNSGASGVTVEVATFRADGPYSDARRPDHITFSDPPSDAARRDFTVNALFLDPLAAPDPTHPTPKGDLSGRVIDYVGGLDDLSARLIRAVGNPDARLAEDHLRALRAVRFAARLGFAIDPGTAAAITRNASQLKGVSRERIGEELRRMLAHPSRADAIDHLERLGLDAPVLNEPPIESTPRMRSRLDASASACAALVAWLLDRLWTTQSTHTGWPLPTQQSAICRRVRAALCLSNEESDDLAQVLRLSGLLIEQFTTASIAYKKRLAAQPRFDWAMTLVRALDANLADMIHVEVAHLNADGIGVSPNPLLTGDHLVAGGAKPGPKFKVVLDSVYDAQLEGRVRTLGEAMELAKSLGV